MKIISNPKDNRYIFLLQEKPGEVANITKYINKVPQYQLLPSYRGIPTPECFIDKFKTQQGKIIHYCSMGLWREIQTHLVKSGFVCNSLNNNEKYTGFDLNRNDFNLYIESLGLPFQVRGYQKQAAWLILKYKRSLSELCTRAGKTLIAYIIFRAAMEYLNVKKILMIVPSVHLVKQGFEDFKEYGDFFKIEQIWAEGSQDPTANITIGTFQSLVLKTDKRNKKYDPDFFKQYDMVCVDECHKLPCKSIQKILACMPRDIKIQFGFTGTLPKEGTIENFCCQAMMGPKIQDIKADELIKEGYLAEPVIAQIRIKYIDGFLDQAIQCTEYLVGNYKTEAGKKILLPKEQRHFTMIHEKTLPSAIQTLKSRLTKQEYYMYLLDLLKASSQTLLLEQMLTQLSKPHIEYISDIIQNLNGNVIVFAHNTEYITYIYNYMHQVYPKRPIYKITGSTTLKKRQKVLDEMLEQNNCVLIGSYGAVGTGLTFKNVDYGIFAQSFKSDIINKQSLGRIMLPTNDKKEFYLYDIIDVFPTKKIYNQGLAKIRTYKEEKYKYTVSDSQVTYTSI